MTGEVKKAYEAGRHVPPELFQDRTLRLLAFMKADTWTTPNDWLPSLVSLTRLFVENASGAKLEALAKDAVSEYLKREGEKA